MVHFEVSPRPLYTLKNEEFFLRLIKTAFSQRRKTLINALAAARQLGPPDRIAEALAKVGIDPKARAESVSPQDYVQLCRTLGP